MILKCAPPRNQNGHFQGTGRQEKLQLLLTQPVPANLGAFANVKVNSLRSVQAIRNDVLTSESCLPRLDRSKLEVIYGVMRNSEA